MDEFLYVSIKIQRPLCQSFICKSSLEPEKFAGHLLSQKMLLLILSSAIFYLDFFFFFLLALRDLLGDVSVMIHMVFTFSISNKEALD